MSDDQTGRSRDSHDEIPLWHITLICRKATRNVYPGPLTQLRKTNGARAGVGKMPSLAGTILSHSSHIQRPDAGTISWRAEDYAFWMVKRGRLPAGWLRFWRGIDAWLSAGMRPGQKWFAAFVRHGEAVLRDTTAPVTRQHCYTRFAPSRIS